MQAQDADVQGQSPLLAWLAATEPKDILAATEYLEKGAPLQSELQHHGELRPSEQASEPDESAEPVWPALAQEEDDYDPRSPEYVQPATSEEVVGERLRLLQQQISHLKVALVTRRELFDDSSDGANDVLEHYQRVLADMVKEETQLLGQEAGRKEEKEDEELPEAAVPSSGGPEEAVADAELGDRCEGQQRPQAHLPSAVLSAAATAAAAAAATDKPGAGPVSRETAASVAAEQRCCGEVTFGTATTCSPGPRTNRKRQGSWSLLRGGARKAMRMPLALRALAAGGSAGTSGTSAGTPKDATLQHFFARAEAAVDCKGVSAAVGIDTEGKKVLQGTSHRGFTAAYRCRARGVRVPGKGSSYMRRIASLSHLDRVLAVYVALKGAHIGRRSWALRRAARVA